MSEPKPFVYHGNLEFSSLMPNPEGWIKEADYDAREAEHKAEVERLREGLRDLLKHNHGLLKIAKLHPDPYVSGLRYAAIIHAAVERAEKLLEGK